MPLSDKQLISALAAQRWTAHNIRLSPNVETIPGSYDFLAENGQLLAVLRTLRLLFSDRLPRARLADLGCLEGGFSLALAQLGANVTGIEVRPENVAKCRLLQEHFALPNLRFVQDDVKNFTVPVYGEFDAVLALGILYHLDRPVEWLRQVGAATRRVLIVETHYAPERDEELKNLRPPIRGLGPLEQFTIGDDVFEGRWLEEYRTESARDAMPWASYSNPRSLWLTRRSILLALRRAGFDTIYEQYDNWIERYAEITREYPRSIFVGAKSTSAAGRRAT